MADASSDQTAGGGPLPLGGRPVSGSARRPGRVAALCAGAALAVVWTGYPAEQTALLTALASAALAAAGSYACQAALSRSIRAAGRPHRPRRAFGPTDDDTKETTGNAMGTSTSEGGAAHRTGKHEHGGEQEGEGGPPPALWRMRTTVVDEPGALAALCTALAAIGVDILALQTHPLGGATVDEFLLRAPGGVEGDALSVAVERAGGTDTWLERAHTHDLVDTPTRVLQMATRTALDSSELPRALRELLGRCRIRSLPQEADGAASAQQTGDACGPAAPPAACFQETVLRLPDPAGGTLVVERPHLPFTPSEFARARALVELEARLGRRLPRRRDAVELPEGGTITVRRADTEDVPAARAMHRRCSAQTLHSRYHGPVGDADRYLRHLLSPRIGRTLAVETAAGHLVALGHLLWDGEETEVALIVEDEWQGRGIGAELLRRLIALAVEARSESVYAVTRAGNTAMIAAMRGLGLPLDYQFEEGTVVISAPLAPAAVPAQPSR
ncbi:GNAT family N-acetyltransferase [Streptomyces sp. P38-E01]|uniref:GNAT family N-acetyltransferase n=1 Tax=Streptomyces tardus TaxID=2780544 RepID=A0A949JIG3_9ACTN|nr:GNAT family N-acetyltransferase [Streptomyces tardus]MBU7600057.1 GNAT family N-acetyltransferase [Streptomyces tardus]